uniref:TTR protein n=1 Tax=Homo sapiens TaxID=9606 RepID=Q13739_HUMAN|nr:ORF4 [Homo sapiens]
MQRIGGWGNLWAWRQETCLPTMVPSECRLGQYNNSSLVCSSVNWEECFQLQNAKSLSLWLAATIAAALQ